jgi:hypothetical protein
MIAMRANLDNRRHAVQIVSALPNEVEDALIVLELARQLVEGFLGGKEPPPKPGPTLAFSAARKGEPK